MDRRRRWAVAEVTHRILHIIPSLDRSGAEKQLVMLAAGLPQNEFDVRVCALSRGGPLAADLDRAGVSCEVIGKRGKLDPLAFLRLRRFVRELRPDLVQTWLFAANSYGRAAALACGVRRIVASERCADPWKRWHELAIDRWLARRTDRIIVNSPGVRDFYVERRLPAEKFVVIPNGVEPAPPPAISRAELLAELGLPANARIATVVARMWPQKRLKDAIWAADLLRVARGDFHVLMVGDGPQRARLERFRDQCQVAETVHLLGHRDDVPRLLAHADVVWLTSEYEGLPNVVMEAMAAGRPVVATDIPGNRDLVTQGETGFLYPVGDRAGLARYTQKLLEDPELANRLGAAGRARIESEFSVARMVAAHAALYRELLA